MNIKISVLVDDRVTKSGFLGEHGLSLYINVDGYKILFDTGQGTALKHNADVLGIKLNEIKNVLLSHGHYDHTGGIKFLNTDYLNIYAHPDIFKPRFKKVHSGEYKNIGFQKIEKKFDKINWILDKNPAALSELVYTSGKVDRITDFEDRVYCILGGTHLINTSANRLKLTANYLKKINLTHLYAGHCTGFNSACYLQYELKDVFKPLETGLELSFNF